MYINYMTITIYHFTRGKVGQGLKSPLQLSSTVVPEPQWHVPSPSLKLNPQRMLCCFFRFMIKYTIFVMLSLTQLIQASWSYHISKNCSHSLPISPHSFTPFLSPTLPHSHIPPESFPLADKSELWILLWRCNKLAMGMTCSRGGHMSP